MKNIVEPSKKGSLQEEKENKPVLSRRDFGKIAAGMGIASLAGFSESLQAEEKSQLLRENMDIKYIDGVMQWKIDRSRFKPFHSKNIAFNTLPRKLGEYWYKKMYRNSERDMKASRHHPEIPASSVAESRAVKALATAAHSVRMIAPFVEGEKYTTDKPHKVPKYLLGPPDETDPRRLTVQTKLAARYLGADLVGCCKLNRDWMYGGFQKNKNSPDAPDEREILFADVEEMVQTDTQLIIPNSVNNVIVMAYEQNREIIQTSPSSMCAAGVGLGYTRQFVNEVALADFIRGLGYIAIATYNAYGMTVPMAVEAGLGEVGRLGVVITPEFGPNVRMTKILTNMPIVPDKPIEFGVQEFCENCLKCARECPSKTITEAPKSWEARSICSQDGVFKWQNDYEKCLEYWVDSGTGCTNCLGVCPFTKGAAWVHNGVQFVIDKMRWAQPVMLGLDDAFGYGERRNPEDIWETTMGTYGLDPKHFKNAMQKGKFPL